MLASKIPVLLFYLTLANMILFSSQHVHYVQPECLTFTRNYRMGHKIGCRKKKGERKKKRMSIEVALFAFIRFFPLLAVPFLFFATENMSYFFLFLPVSSHIATWG